MKNANLESLKTEDLRILWAELWAFEPPKRIGRTMMIKSIQHKQREQMGLGLSEEQKKRLNGLVKSYQRDPKMFDQGRVLKAGTRLVRHYNGKKHSVIVLEDGFEYQGVQWQSLSKIATKITGTAWNGWRFFGLNQ